MAHAAGLLILSPLASEGSLRRTHA